MTPERRRVALRAAGAALRVRQKYDVAADQPCCAYDLAEKLGIEVRFAELPSAEGIYSPNRPAIILSSLRPPGRQAFTCAHEIGHHIYGHGEQFDELVEERANRRQHDPKEYEADCFASALLMPKTALLKGMATRGWNPRSISAEQIYSLASWLGVGYATLVGNMSWGLKLLEWRQAKTLENMKPPQIRRSILGQECKDHLIVADQAWSGRPIDAQVGDIILLPASSIVEGAVMQPVRLDGTGLLLRAATPGVGRAALPDGSWAQFLRVSRKQFSGLGRFRHLEEVEDE